MTRYLLDTCTFIWLCARPEELSATAREAIDAADSSLLLSDVTALEITLKWRAGKIELPDPPRRWIEDQAASWALDFRPLTRSEIYAAGELPRYHHDPFDLLLIATAINLDATILTPDSAIHKYPVSYRW